MKSGKSSALNSRWDASAADVFDGSGTAAPSRIESSSANTGHSTWPHPDSGIDGGSAPPIISLPPNHTTERKRPVGPWLVPTEGSVCGHSRAQGVPYTSFHMMCKLWADNNYSSAIIRHNWIMDTKGHLPPTMPEVVAIPLPARWAAGASPPSAGFDVKFPSKRIKWLFCVETSVRDLEPTIGAGERSKGENRRPLSD